VEAWADDYIYYERQRRPAWQENLLTELRARCGQLEPSAGQVLHATFFGPKRPNADVENLVLYNIDVFNVAGRNGIPMAPSIRTATATRSNRCRAPSTTGSPGESWRRSTGPN
jgi:hypothetical protein